MIHIHFVNHFFLLLNSSGRSFIHSKVYVFYVLLRIAKMKKDQNIMVFLQTILLLSRNKMYNVSKNNSGNIFCSKWIKMNSEKDQKRITRVLSSLSMIVVNFYKNLLRTTTTNDSDNNNKWKKKFQNHWRNTWSIVNVNYVFIEVSD